MSRARLNETVLRTVSHYLQGVDGASVQVNVRGGGAAIVYQSETGDATWPNPLITRSGRIESIALGGGVPWLDVASYDLAITYEGVTYYATFEAIAGSDLIVLDTPTSLTDLSDVTGTPGVGKSPVDDGTGLYNLTPVTTQDDLNDVLGRVASVVWNDIGASGQPAFQSSFRNIGDPWSPARFRLLANSTVRLQGTVTSDDASIAEATWIPIFQLPAGAAPDHNLEFMALTNDNAISRMYVWEDGTVVWGGYAMGPHAPIARLPLNFLSWSMKP